MRLLLLALSLPSLAFAGSATLPIINGEAVAEDEWPSALQIILKGAVQAFETTQPNCTGTLIAPDVVLTAGHCTEDFPLTLGFFEAEFLEFHVSFDEDHSWMLEQEHQGNPPLPDGAIQVSGWEAHPDWDFANLSGGAEINGLDHFNDIALMFLTEPVTDRDFAYLPSAEEHDSIVEDLVVDIVGYGQRTAESGGFGEPPEPGSVGVKYGGEAFLNEVGEWEMQVGDGPETTRKCHGDSGGPSYADIGLVGPERRVIGVTSRAYDQSDCDKGGVDIIASSYLDWIDEAMRRACDDGLRTDCDDPGILVPFDESGDDDDSDGAACNNGCAQGSRGSSSALALLGLLALRRRRQGA